MNLVLCHTPLQVMIACRIIAQQSDAPHQAVMFSYTDNDKFRYYFKQLSAVCSHAEFVLLTPQQPVRHLASLHRLMTNLGHVNYDTVYCASINSLIVHYILSRCRFQHLETFDDGVANIFTDSIYHNPPPLSPANKLLRLLLDVSWDTEQVIKKSILHHTIYPQFNNIIDKTKNISLLLPEAVSAQGIRESKVEKILLGQPLLADADANARLFLQIAQYFGISSYFPHPREQQRINDLVYIDTNKVFEDWLVRRRQLEPDTVFELYHLFSTAALNIIHLSGVRSFAIDSSAYTGMTISSENKNIFVRAGIETIVLA